MSDAVLFSIIAAGGVALVAAGYWLYGRRLRRTTRPRLEQAASLLGGDFDLGRRTASGQLEGYAVRVRLHSFHSVDALGQGETSEWAEIHCKLPKGVAQSMLLRLRSQREADTKLSRDGRLVDLILGHGSFDGAHVVEGAPEDLVRGLLTAEVCGIIAANGVRVDLPDHGSDDELRLTIENWPTPEALSQCLALAARLSKRAGEVLTAAEQAIAEGAAALGQVPAEAVLAVRAERTREIAEVAAMAASRNRRSIMIGVALTAAIVGLALLFVKFS